jgi:hypothetical protein
MEKMNIFEKLLKKWKTTGAENYYVHGSGLIRIPIGRLNEIPKVIQEYHERTAARTRLGIARH